jgi:hypothetical protein
MVFMCKDCKKTFEQKAHYESHLHRKTKCSELQRLQTEYKIYICDKCGEQFTKPNNLYRHKKYNCKGIMKINKQSNEINGKDMNQLFKTFLDYLNNKSNTDNHIFQSINNSNYINTLNTVNANIQNNNNNNIVILSPFGKEGRIKVPKKLLHCLYRNLEEGIPKLVKYIHYNDEFPQFQNIQGKGYDSSIVSVFDGENWILKRKDEAIESLIKEKKEIFDDFFDELEENKHSKLNQKIIQNYNKQSDKLDTVLNKDFYGTQPDKDSKALYKSVQTNINIIMENERIKGKPQFNNTKMI